MLLLEYTQGDQCVSSRSYTVAELIAKLSTLPQDAIVQCPDRDGYDGYVDVEQGIDVFDYTDPQWKNKTVLYGKKVVHFDVT